MDKRHGCPAGVEPKATVCLVGCVERSGAATQTAGEALCRTTLQVGPDDYLLIGRKQQAYELASIKAGDCVEVNGAMRCHRNKVGSITTNILTVEVERISLLCRPKS
jgi:hypothetical protein